MKVCLLNDSFPPVIDGVANTVANYAKILNENNLADVIVGTPGYPNADYEQFPYKVVPYKSIDIKNLMEGYRIGNPIAPREMGVLTDFNPDIIHTHCPAVSTIMARMMRHELKVPVVFTYHTKFDVDIAKAIRSKTIQKETLKAIVSNVSACDEVWVVSEGAGENLVSLGYEGEYRIMTNGVDFQKGRATDDMVKSATKGYDLPEGVPVFLFVGRIMKYKGLPIIVDALNILNKAGIDFRMVFVGQGADREEIESKINVYGMADKVFFTGPISNREVLRTWNTRADLFLFPSTYDTNGIVVREAAACGLGSVLISGSCAAEGISDGRNGFLVEENAESMAELLKELSSHLDKMHDVGQHAMDEIYVSWEQSVRIAHARYEEIIELKAKGALSNRKRQVNDLLFAFGSEWLDSAQRMFNQVDSFQSNIDDWKNNARSIRNELQIASDNFEAGLQEKKDNLSDQIHENMSNIKNDFKKSWDEFSTDMRGIVEDIKEGMMENIAMSQDEINNIDGNDK